MGYLQDQWKKVLQSVEIKVSTDTLVNASSDVRSFMKSLGDVFDTIEDIIVRSGEYWDGDGHMVHLESYQRKKETAETILKRFSENADDLEKIAGVYVETERANVEEAEALPVDIIS